MRLLHSLADRASFDDPDLVSHAGLVPVMALAQRAGLTDLVAEYVTPGGECGVKAYLKAGCLVAGMAAGADSIGDMDVLRHGAMGTPSGGVRAPSALGSHLRCYTWGNVTQLEKAGREFLADVSSGPLAHLPTDGVFAANAAWLSIAAMAYNLVRAASALASLPFAKARGATIRRDLIAVAARTARHGRGHLTLHLPEGRHHEQEWLNPWDAACGPPAAAA